MSIFGNANNYIISENSVPNKVIDLKDIHSDKDDESYSFMIETYAFLEAYQRDYNNVVKQFYKNILESADSQEVINESFGDFFRKAKEIIKKFLEFIKKIFAKFVTKLNSLFKSEKYLEKHKNDFAKFESEDEFTISGYKYTVIGNTAPVNKAVDLWFSDVDNGNISSSNIDRDDLDYSSSTYNDVSFDSGVDDIESKKNKAKAQQNEVVLAIEKKYRALVDGLDDWYDKFRGHILGKNEDITSTEYDEELFRVFRDDYDKPTDITIDYNAVNTAYSEFTGYHNLIREIEKDRREIESNYQKLERALETALHKEKSGDGMFTVKFNVTTANAYASNNMDKLANASGIKANSDIYNKIDLYMRAKVTQIQTMSSIHTQAFSAKLQAAKDNFVQNKQILYKALSKIQSHKKK